jgi:hypothetical protein
LSKPSAIELARNGRGAAKGMQVVTFPIKHKSQGKFNILWDFLHINEEKIEGISL